MLLAAKIFLVTNFSSGLYIWCKNQIYYNIDGIVSVNFFETKKLTKSRRSVHLYTKKIKENNFYKDSNYYKIIIIDL